MKNMTALYQLKNWQARKENFELLKVPRWGFFSEELRSGFKYWF